MKKIFTIFIILIVSNNFFAQSNKKDVQKSIEKRAKDYENIAKSIWGWAEKGYLEEKSSALLQKTLSDAGFSIKAGVADIPTAFVAEYGSGLPIIGI